MSPPRYSGTIVGIAAIASASGTSPLSLRLRFMGNDKNDLNYALAMFAVITVIIFALLIVGLVFIHIQGKPFFMAPG